MSKKKQKDISSSLKPGKAKVETNNGPNSDTREGSISPEFVFRPVQRTYFRRSRSKSVGRSDSEGGKSESEARSDVEDDRKPSQSPGPFTNDGVFHGFATAEGPEKDSINNKYGPSVSSLKESFNQNAEAADSEIQKVKRSVFIVKELSPLKPSFVSAEERSSAKPLVHSVQEQMPTKHSAFIIREQSPTKPSVFISNELSPVKPSSSVVHKQTSVNCEGLETKNEYRVDDINPVQTETVESLTKEPKSPEGILIENNDQKIETAADLVEFTKFSADQTNKITDHTSDVAKSSTVEAMDTSEQLQEFSSNSENGNGDYESATPAAETESDAKVDSSEVKVKKRGRKKKSLSVLEKGEAPPVPLRRTSRVIRKTRKALAEHDSFSGKKALKSSPKMSKQRSKSDTDLLGMAAEDNDSVPLARSIYRTGSKCQTTVSNDEMESASKNNIDLEKQVTTGMNSLTMEESQDMEVAAFEEMAKPGLSRSAPTTPLPRRVKSRNRRSSEQEQKYTSDSDTTPLESPKAVFERVPLTVEEKNELDKRLSEFEQIEGNVFLTRKSTSKERMHCDCTLTKEEIAFGEKGCLEDCLNRLLMIECGPDCSLKSNCMNKYFQERKNANIEVFKTDRKGFGLRAVEDTPPGTFIMEYVGEVINLKQFEKRKKQYAKDSTTHYYFMALKNDTIIDATSRGNISRFINHSCYPNCETQKWTVNGELRIGFFTKAEINAGEELTFDYQYERYGKEAQKCYCESTNCRGWIGEVPSDEEEEEEEEESFSSEDDDLPLRPPKPKEEALIQPVEEIAAEEPVAVSTETKMVEKIEIDKVEEVAAKIEESVEEKPVKIIELPQEVGLRKKKRKTRLARLFKEDDDLDVQISKLLESGLKNKTQTLTFCRLMVRAEKTESRRSLLSLLSEERSDPACRRLLLDYHGLRLLGGWLSDPATTDEMKLEILQAIETLPIPNKTLIIESKVFSIVEKWSQGHDSSPQRKDEDASEDNNEALETETMKVIRELSKQLLESWSSLKEVFRIPKKERIEAMKEHEREADRNEQIEQRCWPSKKFHESRNDRWSFHDRLDREHRKREHFSPDWKRKEITDSLSKDERRQRFMLQVQQEEEEIKRKKVREELAKNHEAQCFALGLDPKDVPLFLDPTTGEPLVQPPPPPEPGVDPSSLTYYIDPLTGQWTVYMPEHMHLPPGYDPSTIGRFSYDTDTGMMIESHTGYQLDPTQPLGIAEFLMANYPVKNMDYDPDEGNYPSGTLIFNLETGEMHIVDENKPFIKEEKNAFSLSENAMTLEEKLPPKWASAVDSQGRTYYYHIRDRVPQWNKPECQFDEESETEESETDTDDDESMDIELPSGRNILTPPMETHTTHEKLAQRERRRGLLVQEHLISPRDENEPRNPYLNKESAQAYRRHMMKEKIVKRPGEVDTGKDPEKARERIRKEKEKLKAKYKATLKKLSYKEKKLKERKMRQKIKQEEMAKRRAMQSEELRKRIKEKLESSVYGTAEQSKLDDKEEIEPSVDNEMSEFSNPVEVKVDNSESVKIQETEIISETPKEELVEETKEVNISTEETKDVPEIVQEEKPEPELSDVKTVDLPVVEDTSENTQPIKEETELQKHKKERLDFENEKGKRIKEEFRKNISNLVISTLNPFMRSDAKYARITSSDDFKHLARKFTHFVMQKELKHCRTVDDYVCSDLVKQKAKDFIRKYMKKFGPVYKKGLDEDLKI